MLANDSSSHDHEREHFLDLQSRASRQIVWRATPSVTGPADPDTVEDPASASPSARRRTRASRSLRSCFRSARPSLATFDLDWFVKLCLAARDLDDVHVILHMLHEGIGASASALVNVGPTRSSPIFELLNDVPDTLLEAIRSRRTIDDPLMVACEQRVLGFAASDLDRIIDMTEARREMMAIYAAHGLVDGFTVPFCVPNEPRGFCSFGFADPDDLTMDVAGIINLTGNIMFETARRVQGMWTERRIRAELTPRQLDCLAGAARGLNDGQIAWELGISTQTVHDHIEAARRRYGARKRTDLMVRAIRSGDLHWDRITGRTLGEH